MNDKNTKRQEIATDEAKKIVSNILTQYTEGFTLEVNCEGYYTHEETKETVKEASFIILLYFTSNATINKIIKELKQAFNQESIARVTTPCKVSFE